MAEMNNHYNKIIESLRLLTLPYEEQQLCFPDFVDTPFEIIDTFENAFLLLPNLVEQGLFSNAGIAGLLRLHNIINITLSNPIFKDIDKMQFKENEAWNKVRLLTKEVLQLLGEPLQKPDLRYI